MKWNATKYFLPSIVGLFFGYVASIFTEWRNTVPYFDYQKFIESLWLIFPFIGTVFAITIFTDVTAFGWEKTKKNIPGKLLAMKRWVQKERLGNFEKKLFIGDGNVFLDIQAEKRFPFSSKLSVVVDYKEKRSPILKKDFESKMKYEIARLSSMVHNHSPKSFEIVSGIKLSNSVPKTFEIFSFDEKENIFWLHQKTGKPEVFWNNDEFRELEYMSFGYGEHEFELSIKNIGIFGINFNEKYSFVVSYEKTGVALKT
jgi:hypothetical protein